MKAEIKARYTIAKMHVKEHKAVYIAAAAGAATAALGAFLITRGDYKRGEQMAGIIAAQAEIIEEQATELAKYWWVK